MEKKLSNYSLFLFDMDGTLVKFKLDFEYLKRITRKSLEDKGIYLGTIASLNETLKDLGPFFPNESDYNEFVETIENIIVKHELETSIKAEAFPDSKELLQLLKTKGKKVGIITRNSKAATIKTLEVSGLNEYIDFVVTREDVKNPKPSPEHVEVAIKYMGKNAEDTVVIGDHKYDIYSGKNAGCYTIGVLSGVSSEELLNEADLVVTSLGEIISFL